MMHTMRFREPLPNVILQYGVQMSRNPVFLLTHLLIGLTVLMGSMLTSVQAMYSTNSSIVVHAMFPDIPSTPETLTDEMLFAWSAGGSIIGGWISLVMTLLLSPKEGSLIPLPNSEDPKKFAKLIYALSVSVLGGIVATPAIGYYLALTKWPLIFLLGASVAWATWLILKVAAVLLNRFLLRANEDGLSGVMQEIRGGGKLVQTTMQEITVDKASAPVTPPAPPPTK